MSLTIKQRPCAELRPHPANPRRGNVEVLAESLRVNGQFKPIVTTADGTVLAGNHTFAAAQQEGMDSLACVVLSIDPNSDEALRIMAADNRTSDLGGYDDAALTALLSQLDAAGGLEGSGYDPDDLADLLAELEELEALDPVTPYVDDAAPAGTRITPSFEEDAQKYADRATRLIVLPLGNARYAWLNDALARIATDLLGDADATNADVVIALAAKHLGEEPPADELDDEDDA